LYRLVAAVALSVLLLAGFVPATPVGAAAPADPKVVVIVGATHGSTSNYRSRADVIAAEAAKYTPNVVKVYSPNATWAAVRAAIQGASVVVYLGHGNGFPNPYSSTRDGNKVDGFGLNLVAGQGDNNTRYYGENYIRNEVRLAPNAVVILNHLCYASGNSEPGHAEPTVGVAHQRIDNFSAGFIGAGAHAVVADAHTGGESWIRALFTTRQTMEAMFHGHLAANGNSVSWGSSRNPGFVSYSDPDTPTRGFYRSLVTRPGLTTDEVTGARFAETDHDPSDFVVPGAASAGGGGAAVHPESTLTSSPVANLPPDTRVRVVDEPDVTAAGRVMLVTTLDGTVGGYVGATGLVPRDSQGPVLWGVDDRLAFSPNGDGVGDVLAVDGSFSEEVDWTFRVTDAGGAVVAQSAGHGEDLATAWDGNRPGGQAPDGIYAWSVTAVDDWGNAPYGRGGQLVVDRRPETRLAGVDRYATAAAISAASFPAGVAVAYVATGWNFPDALAGAAVAGRAKGPVLLVAPTSIPAATANELARLRPASIVVLGAAGVVSDGVVAALRAHTAGPIVRFAGVDRYATAAAVSAATFAPGVPIAFIATGRNFPDALAGAAAAAKLGGPILLVDTNAIPAPTSYELARLGPARIVVLGGPGVVSDGVLATLRGYTAGPVDRLFGADRYSTAAAISAATVAPRPALAYVATGANFPDALAGAAAAGSKGAPVLLVTAGSIPAATAAELTRLGPARIVVLGGPPVVSDEVKFALAAYERP
jgi:putative cell wall-binding protein